MAYLHYTGPGTEQVQAMEPGLLGSNTLQKNVCTDLRQRKEPDPLSPIVPVPFPVPVPVPAPCSVNKP